MTHLLAFGSERRLSSAATMPFWRVSSVSRSATLASSISICYSGIVNLLDIATGIPDCGEDMDFIGFHTKGAGVRHAGRCRPVSMATAVDLRMSLRQ